MVRSAACKNMAMANWKIAKAKTETGATSSSISFYFKEALKHFQVRLLGFHAKTAMTPLTITLSENNK